MKQLLRTMCFLLFLCFFVSCSYSNTYVCAKNSNSDINMNIDGNEYFINNKADRFLKLTERQQKNKECSDAFKIDQIKKMKKMGFSSEEILKYIYPFLHSKVCDVINNESLPYENAFFSVEKNTAQ